MNVIITLLRITSGILVGFVGCLALLIAMYQLASASFRLASEGPLCFISLVFGTGLLWVAWRLIHGGPAPSSFARRK